MKAMRTPKMDVVRFTESDVIVASSIVRDTLQLAGYNNNTMGDATINNHSVADFVAILNEVHTATGDVYLSDVAKVNVNNLAGYEDQNNAYLRDGNYVWDGTDTWKYQ